MGIESSAHTFGVGIVRNGRILANEKSMYRIGTTGMIPAKVAQFHSENASEVMGRALSAAKIGFEDLDGIGYTMGPGMGHCLQVGALSAKTVARMLRIPIAPVNHAVGHIEIVRHLSGMKDPLALYVSGGNSQILKRSDGHFPHYRVLGETFDIGVGNMLDTFARKMKLDPAWGSSVEKKAMGGRYMKMPYTVKGMDFSFTGLLTHSMKQIGHAKDSDICFSLQETAFSMLCEATERALLLTNSKELEVCGGVAQNSRLREMLASIAKEHGARFGSVEKQYDADNGAMIAVVAERMLKKGMDESIGNCGISQRYRADSARLAGA
ncbi:MAG: tRNA (adenosine(37)-N6)-threonylcarbamoyltransferase complex transferase subunit TsaD [Candidatus Micrarchaeota archaeon]|nr:tRNA (adenosine(37)-N6)-threonylcarbamoyltransferase complex transferase subunit TsaD [Candidatus Micrarchaeota archaeon]